MTSLYVDRREARLALERGAVVIRIPGERPASVPLRGLERVVLRAGTHIATSLLAELWRRDVGVAVLAGRGGEVTARFLGRPRRDLRRRLLQYELVRDPARRLAFAREVVTARIRGSRRLLVRLAEEGRGARHRLKEAATRLAEGEAAARRAGSLAALLGLEGTAAATFFEAYATLFAPALGFAGRNRRPPRDPVNACLSLGYTLLHVEAARRARLHGFDPMLGALHAPAAGRESFACDLVEPLRCHIERLVADLFAEGVLRARDFRRSGEACYLARPARQRFYQHYERRQPALARLLARLCRRWARELERRVPLTVPVEDAADTEERPP